MLSVILSLGWHVADVVCGSSMERRVCWGDLLTSVSMQSLFVLLHPLPPMLKRVLCTVTTLCHPPYAQTRVHRHYKNKKMTVPTNKHCTHTRRLLPMLVPWVKPSRSMATSW